MASKPPLNHHPPSDDELDTLYARAYETYGQWASYMTPDDLVRLSSDGGWRADVREGGWSGVYRRIDDGVDQAPIAKLLRLKVWCETDEAGRVELIRSCADAESPANDDVLRVAEPLRYVRTLELACLPEYASAAAVSDTGLRYLAGWTALDRIVIDGLGRTTALGFQALSNAAFAESLRDVELRGFTDAAAVTSFLGRSPALQRVDLYSPTMTDHALKNLYTCTGLVSLAITGGKITGEFMEPFRQSALVRDVSLDSEVFGDYGIALISDRFPKTQELSVRSPMVTERGLRLLPKLKELESLRLENGTVNAAGVVELRSIRSLKNLSLDCTNVGDDDVEAISRLQSLRSLSLFRTNITAHRAAALRRSLPQCRIHGP